MAFQFGFSKAAEFQTAGGRITNLKAELFPSLDQENIWKSPTMNRHPPENTMWK